MDQSQARAPAETTEDADRLADNVLEASVDLRGAIGPMACLSF